MPLTSSQSPFTGGGGVMYVAKPLDLPITRQPDGDKSCYFDFACDGLCAH